MKKIILVLCLVFVFIFANGLAQGQMSTDKNIITLPNGDLIWDLNGEWVVLVENIGKWTEFGNYAQLWKITQTGSSFVAVRMINDKYNYTDSEVVRGELNKNGISKATVFTNDGPKEAKGQIDYDGNKLIIKNDNQRYTATRR
jgi:hypothetical protein